MANQWFRLWVDMVNDPKWRTIARVSDQKVGDVIAVYVHMMTMAANASERGRTEGWNDEDVATALDIETSQVQAIRCAMQGRVLDGDYLTGWEKRQPLREDGAADRAKAWREAQKEQKRMQANAPEREQTLDKIREEEIKTIEPIEGTVEVSPKRRATDATATRLPPDWQPSDTDLDFCHRERPDLDPLHVASRFRDYWVGVGGAKGRKVDWPATWRNWVRNEKMPTNVAKFDPVAAVNRNRSRA